MTIDLTRSHHLSEKSFGYTRKLSGKIPKVSSIAVNFCALICRTTQLFDDQRFRGFFAELRYDPDADFPAGPTLDGRAAEIVERVPHLVVEFEP